MIACFFNFRLQLRPHDSCIHTYTYIPDQLQHLRHHHACHSVLHSHSADDRWNAKNHLLLTRNFTEQVVCVWRRSGVHVERRDSIMDIGFRYDLSCCCTFLCLSACVLCFFPAITGPAAAADRVLSCCCCYDAASGLISLTATPSIYFHHSIPKSMMMKGDHVSNGGKAGSRQ